MSIDALASEDGTLRVADPVAIGDRISEIRAPTLVIAGDSDILIPPENGRILAEKIPGAEFRSIEGAGHLFWISHPNETYSAVTGFLESKNLILHYPEHSIS
ncbi:MAG TPA: alpha/beta fold hydrolase [Methanotrichaceae archaeon]|nr:alpha/beta fold hydrolase [Methanotrichaceae archaeon]